VINCATAGPGPSELGTIGPFEPEAASRRCPEHHLAPANDFEDAVYRTHTVRLKADGVPVHVEEPGWACPCWADMDGDGKKDLLVGQFNGGKIRVYRNLGDGKLAAGDWLKADGAVAEIPGVW
jgi:hypothetical protein